MLQKIFHALEAVIERLPDAPALDDNPDVGKHTILCNCNWTGCLGYTSQAKKHLAK